MNPLRQWRQWKETDKQTANKLATLFILGGLVPVSLVVFSTAWAQWAKDTPRGPMMMSEAHAFASGYILLYIAALAATVLLLRQLWRTHPSLAKTVTVGIASGALATLALDGLRLVGVSHGWLPMDTVELFGTVILGPGSDPNQIYAVGFAYHIINGASFGLIYGLVWGRQPNTKSALKAGIGLLVVIELGMMSLPPMQPIVGPFGVDHAWPALFLITLAAHVAFGAVMAMIVQGAAPRNTQE